AALLIGRGNFLAKNIEPVTRRVQLLCNFLSPRSGVCHLFGGRPIARAAARRRTFQPAEFVGNGSLPVSNVLIRLGLLITKSLYLLLSLPHLGIIRGRIDFRVA